MHVCMSVEQSRNFASFRASIGWSSQGGGQSHLTINKAQMKTRSKSAQINE